MARTKLSPKKRQESFLSLMSSFGFLGKEAKITAEHVIMNKILALFTHGHTVNKDFVHSSSIGLKKGKLTRYVIIINSKYIRIHLKLC